MMGLSSDGMHWVHGIGLNHKCSFGHHATVGKHCSDCGEYQPTYEELKKREEDAERVNNELRDKFPFLSNKCPYCNSENKSGSFCTDCGKRNQGVL